MNVRRLLVIGVSTLFVGIVWMFPARVAHHWFTPHTVQIAGIDGSVWNGSARETMISGAYLRDLSWRFRPARLLLGQLAYRIEADPAGGFLETDVSVGVTGTVNLRNLNAALPLSALQAVMRMDDVSGDVALQLSSARFIDGWPSEIDGNVGVSQLRVRALAAAPVGNFTAELQSTDEGIVGSVEDVSGMLDVAATLRLNPDRSYSLIGQVGSTTEAPASLTRQLQFLGSPDARGMRDFRLEGRF